MWGVYVHAKAGEQLEKQFGTLGFLAREIADAIPSVIRRLEAGAA
jgi:NAD(P)H-hydrate repair Nnr-like enzyme with NAD(P)H-hydrate dehydratase domain